MNKIPFILLTILSLNNIFSQSESVTNFKIEENEILWQKVIKLKNTKEKYIEQLKLKEFFTNLDRSESSIVGKSNKKDLKIKSPYWSSFPFDCFVKIEFKENRFRITFSNITFDGPEIEVYGVKQKYDYKLSEEGKRKGKLKKSKNILKVFSELNKFFENITSENQIEKKSNW